MPNSGAIVPNIIVGLIVTVLGVLIVRNRKGVNKEVRRSQRAILGERVARASAGRQAPLMMGIVGALFVGVGLFMVGAGVFVAL